MREIIYEGKSYQEPDCDTQKAVSAGGIHLFRYYPKDRLVIVAEVTAEKFSCHRFYPNMPQSFADDMIYEEDKTLFYTMYQEIDQGEKKATSIFRLKDKVTNVRVVLSVLDVDEKENASVVVGMVEDVTEEVAKKEERKHKEQALYEDQIRLTSMNRALSSNFNNVYLVDLADGSTRSYDISDEIKKEYGNRFFRGEYSSMIQIYVKQSVYQPDVILFDHIIDVSHLRETLSEKDSDTFNYRITRDEKVQYFQCRAVKVQIENKDYCVIAFRDINAEVIKELEQKTILEQQRIQLKDALTKSEQYKNAVLADAIIIYEFNLSKNVIQEEMWEIMDGDRTELLAVVGMTAPADYDVFHSRWTQQQVLPEYQEIYEREAGRAYLLKQFQEGHAESTFEFRAVMGCGKEVLMRHTIFMARDEETGDIIAYCNVKDITEQKMREMQIRQYEQLFIVTAANIYTGILQVALDTCMAKRIMLRGGKITVEDVGGWDKYLEDQLPFVHPDDAQAVADALGIQTLMSIPMNEKKIFSYKSITKNEENKYKSFFTTTYMTEVDGKQYGIVVTIDNTNTVEKELRQKELIEDALARAEAANRAKTTFLSNMSHDIRTPMNAIIGFTTLATTHIDKKDQVRDYLGKIMSASNHLLSLINDILDMSRIESGRMQLEEVECSLSEIMHGLRNILQADMKSKRLNFYIDTVDVFHENVICDKLRLNQVLLNLLGNAVKFTEPGGSISVRICQKPAESKEFGRYEFHVKDTGIGMSAEFLKHIFEPFERERTSTVSGIQGTGLGMPITKNIVEMMGGTIEVKSKKGEGTEFIVEIPMKKMAAEEAEIKVKEMEGVRALVVDDDFNTCDSVSNMLIQIGMRAEWTMSGREAVLRTRQAIDRGDEYRVYVIDWLIPDMNGIETARQIRKEVGDDAPIIILTAYDWSDIAEEAKEAGVTAFCSKPLFISDLRRCLINILHPKKAENATEFQRENINGQRLLLVEDIDLNREIASTILSEAGFIIEEAENGQEALDRLLQKGAGYYSLVLMDVQMPVMNGYEATKAIRALEDPKLANIPIIAMTADAFEEDKQKALEAGMNAHVAKPIEMKKLLDTLEGILKIEN
ncbi:MAG: response regulator [Eubacteriales bacterium]|nr:response regulator [Eubacteriales bacterium]